MEVRRTALYQCTLKYLKLNPVVARELELELKKDGLHKRPRAQRQPIMSKEIGEPSHYNEHHHRRDNNNKRERVKIMHARQGRDQKTVSTETSVDNKSKLPTLPPIPALNGLIAECSKPYEKSLTESDIKDDQSRVTINKRFVEDELVKLLKPDERIEKGIKVKAYDSEGMEYKRMLFKRWGRKMYVLTKSWKQFCHDHKFVKDIDFITLWMFRNTSGELCFAITSRRENA